MGNASGFRVIAAFVIIGLSFAVPALFQQSGYNIPDASILIIQVGMIFGSMLTILGEIRG